MNLSIEQIEIDHQKSFRSERIHIPFFDVAYHYHPEIELVLFLRGDGKMFVKDTMVPFSEGTLFIIGSNVPHLPISHPRFKDENSNETIEYVVIQADQSYFEESLFELPEISDIKALIKDSNQGILISNFHKTNLFEPLKNLNDLDFFDRLMSFISILNKIKKEHSYKLIDHSNKKNEITIIDERMKRVNKFLIQNYNKEVSLDEVAAIAIMNKASFCRYFKAQTGKTFSAYINDLRIHYSKKLLIGGSYTVKRIAYEVGYNNPTYFIKRFTDKNEVSPKKYRELHR